ncbi:MAG: hypothetical protein ABFE13_09055 [Phycisphaerales bacterium]
MAEKEPAKLPSSLPLIVAAATISAAILISYRPLASSRPSPPSRLEPAVQDANVVDAMLWQDPFEVALDHERGLHCGAAGNARSILRPCSSTHSISRVGYDIDEAVSGWRRATTDPTVLPRRAKNSESQSPVVHILMVMVPDEGLAEDYEVRLRNRYALLTALRVSGMAPMDTRHIDYFRAPHEWEWTPKPVAFPYEWFEPDRLHVRDPNTDARPGRVLVLWLPHSAFEKQPLGRIVRLLEALNQRMPIHDLPQDLFHEMWHEDGLVQVDLIGPSQSTVLRAMLDEIDPNEGRDNLLSRLQEPKDHDDKPWLRIYSPWSTASPALLVKDWDSHKVQDATGIEPMFEVIPTLFETTHIKFVRMIGTDDLLAMEIINELERRGVRVVSGRDDSRADQIVLISEWDTFYGKAFPLTFESMMRSLRDGKAVVDHRVRGGQSWFTRLCQSRQVEPNWTEYADDLAASVQTPIEPPVNLHVYGYLIGIDGRLPKAQGQNSETPYSETQTASKWAYAENLELPIGQGQLDYARRLAQRLHDEFGGVRRGRLKAIGVVGGDVYDKLILLHAMRERFDSVILFTTDLDARFLHHEQFRWTRNVVVASNYGLELHPAYHGSAERWRQTLVKNLYTPSPPFRDNYQTALFLACRTAMGVRRDNVDCARAIRDMEPNELASLLVYPRIFEVGRGKAVDLSLPGENDGLHPPRHTQETRAKIVASMTLLFIAFGITVLLCIPLARGLTAIAYWGCRPAGSNDKSNPRRRTSRVIIFVLLGGILLLFTTVVVYDHFAHPDGEPFSLTTGVSGWPGLALWLIGIILCVSFTVSLFRILRESSIELAADFGLRTPKDIPSPASDVLRCCTRVRSLATNIRRMCHEHTRKQTDSNLAKPGRSLWRRVIYGGSDDVPAAHGTTQVDAQEFWNQYVRNGCPYRRIVKAIGSSIVFLALTVGLTPIFGRPFVPCRGVASRATYCFLVILLLPVLLFLLFLVIDAIGLCLRLIGPLIANETIWPRNAAHSPSTDRTTPWLDREGWMDVRFIARMTEATGKLIYMPAIVLMFMIAGRFWYFDHWGFPPQGVFVYGAITLWLGICAVELLWAAKRARAAALNGLNEKLRSIDFGVNADKERAGLIKAMIDDIRSIRQGAFRPLAENPVLHFMLIPSGGLGLLTLLSHALSA